MTKTDFVSALAEQTGFKEKDVAAMYDVATKVIIDTVASGEDVVLTGFGTFKQRQRNAKTGINPRTKEKISVPAKTVPVFKAGKVFKDAVL